MVMNDHAEDPHVCRIMQTGGARVLPANYMNSSLWVGEEDGDGLVGPLELISRMAGSISLSGHIAKWSSAQAGKVRRHIRGFKSYRHLLMKDFYALSPYPRGRADWDVVQFLDPETGEAVILAFRYEGSEEQKRIVPRKLKPEVSYRVEQPFSADHLATLTGDELNEKGLTLVLMENSAEARHLKPASS
jgi:hypothetical protein